METATTPENLRPQSSNLAPQLNYQVEFATILFEEFEKCRTANPRFSIRAFARKININPATLSSIFKGKRKLPKKHALDIVERLKLKDGRRNRFLRSLKIELPFNLESDLAVQTEPKRKVLDPVLNRRIIVDWEYYAVFHVLEIPGQWNLEKIAQKLSLPNERVQEVLTALETAQLIKNSDGIYFPNQAGGLCTTDDITCDALRLAHENELRLAIEKLYAVPIERRDFTSRTFPIDPSKLPEAKKIIRRLSQELGDLLTDGKKEDVYLLAVQLFPLTEEESTHE